MEYAGGNYLLGETESLGTLEVFLAVVRRALVPL